MLDVARPLVDLCQRLASPAIRRDGNPPSRERVEQLPLRLEGKRSAGWHRDRIAEESERTLRRDRRIELPQRAGGRVARIREDRLAGCDALLVQLLEETERQIALAANLDECGDVITPQPRRHVGQRGQFAVTSSPTMPLPRVVPTVKTPS